MKNRFNKKMSTSLAILGVGLMIILGSCKKFLDQQPITDVGPEFVFSDVPSTYKAIVGVYSRLTGDQGYGIRLSLYYPVDNDEMQGPTGALDNDRRDMARYSLSSTNAQLERPFNQLFQGIEYANICIDNIPKMALYSSGSEQQKKQLQRMYGEALTLRAQFYFEAIRNWGDLPAHFQPAYSQASADAFPRRTDRDTLYNRIIADLDLAADLLPWKNEVSAIGDAIDERLTKGTAKGLRARIALFRGGYSLRQNASMQRSADYLSFYQIAREETNDIITSNQHSLNPGFRALWKDQVGARVAVDPQGELMFQVSGIGGGSAADTKLGYYNGPRMNNFGNSSINPLPTYFYLFDSTDLRRDVTIAPYNVNSDGVTKAGQAITALNDGKYRRDWMTNPTYGPTNAAQYFQLKWQILRYADVLLMFAEAENELNGPTTAAYNAVNMVRRRGFGKSINTPDAIVDLPAGLSKADFFKAIVRERALELGGEGIRKYDLMRWNLMNTAFSESKANMVRMSTNTALVNPTYMAGYPSYVLTATLPTYMYFKNNNTSDDRNLWYNSFYEANPTTTPAGTTRVNWLTAAINTTAAARFATAFTTGKSELFPIPQPARDANFNLSQNPGY
jgi:starch-binding outer membrane protein, SusD/RagB family